MAQAKRRRAGRRAAQSQVGPLVSVVDGQDGPAWASSTQSGRAPIAFEPLQPPLSDWEATSLVTAADDEWALLVVLAHAWFDVLPSDVL